MRAYELKFSVCKKYIQTVDFIIQYDMLVILCKYLSSVQKDIHSDAVVILWSLAQTNPQSKTYNPCCLLPAAMWLTLHTHCTALHNILFLFQTTAVQFFFFLGAQRNWFPKSTDLTHTLSIVYDRQHSTLIGMVLLAKWKTQSPLFVGQVKQTK